MKRRGLSLLLTVLLLLSLTACASHGANSTVQATFAPLRTVTPAPTASPPPSPDLLPTSPPPSDNLSDTSSPPVSHPSPTPSAPLLSEDGIYDSKDDVAQYLLKYDHLPPNYITKQEAEALGWPGGSLEPYAPGKCIGGNRFGNFEEMLPKAPGRTYYECDIDTLGAKSRGAKRLVYSNDGLIYYTDDHYETFQLLYGDP